jgi:hypothetical protein
MRTRATAQKAPPVAAVAASKRTRTVKKKAPPVAAVAASKHTRTVKTRSKKHEKRNSSLPPIAAAPAKSPKNEVNELAPAPVQFAAAKVDDQLKPNPHFTKPKKKNRMVMSRVKKGPDTYVIPCPEANCQDCRTFYRKTIVDVNKKASLDNKSQTQIVLSEILLASSSSDDRKIVDLTWDQVPALFRTISAYTKMKNHLKVDHMYGDMIPNIHPCSKEQRWNSSDAGRKKRRSLRTSTIPAPSISTKNNLTVLNQSVYYFS